MNYIAKIQGEPEYDIYTTHNIKDETIISYNTNYFKIVGATKLEYKVIPLQENRTLTGDIYFTLKEKTAVTMMNKLERIFKINNAVFFD